MRLLLANFSIKVETDRVKSVSYKWPDLNETVAILQQLITVQIKEVASISDLSPLLFAVFLVLLPVTLQNPKLSWFSGNYFLEVYYLF